MTEGVAPKLVSSFTRVSRVCSAALIALGTVVLAGWMLNITTLKSVSPGFASMKANTALSFVALGVALWSTPVGSSARMRRASALLVMLIAGLTLAEYVFRVNLGIDQILFVDSDSLTAPGRMAPATATMFVLFATAVLLADFRKRRPSDVVAGLAAVFAFVSFCGYAYDADSLYRMAPYVSIAFHTTIGLLLASVAFFFARPDEGVTSLLVSDTAAGTLLRRVLPLIVLIPVALGWLRLRGERAALYNAAFGTAFHVAMNVILLTIVVAVVAASLHSSELDRRTADRARRDDRQRSTEQFRHAIDAAPTGMIMVDTSAVIVLVNAQTERLFGYSREELLGQRIETLIPDRFRGRHPALHREFFRAPSSRPMGAGRELFGRRKDGVEVPVEIGLNPLTTADGEFVLCSVVDIGERKRSEREREALLHQLTSLNADLEERVRRRTGELVSSLKEREILLQEVHHRVKNNLQVITSLINMQVRKMQNGSSRVALEDCRNRVGAIALIHEKLYQSRDYARVSFADYVRGLASDIFSASGTAPDRVALQLSIADVTLTVDKAIPCGLILNELITNAIKHAFPGERTGRIAVTLQEERPGRLELVVADDGIGMPADFVAARPGSLGMQLVSTLAEQLHGTVDTDGRNGTTIRIAFPTAAEPPRDGASSTPNSTAKGSPR